MKLKLALFSLVIISLAVLSCKKEKAQGEPEPTPAPTSVSFATDVQPIFQASCGTGGSCHGAGARGNADGKVYETHAGASAVDGPVTLGAIKHEAGFSQMPQIGGKLSNDKIAKIEAWIDGGKKDD